MVDESKQRAVLEDLVRIHRLLEKCLKEGGRHLLVPPPGGGWTLSESVLHVILTLEECAGNFEAARDTHRSLPATTWGQRLARRAVLMTFRWPPGLSASVSHQPDILLDEDTLLRRSLAARDHLVRLESVLRQDSRLCEIHHVTFGRITLDQAVRLLLIHALHHKSLMQRRLKAMA